MATITAVYNDRDINRTIIAASDKISQIEAAIDDNIKQLAVTYVLNKRKTTEADVLVLTLASKIKEITNNGSNTSN